jgi:hypothetical protein
VRKPTPDIGERVREHRRKLREMEELLHPPWKRELQTELEAQRVQREIEQLRHQVDGLLHPPEPEPKPKPKGKRKGKRGAPFKLTPDEAKRGIMMIRDEKRNDPRLTMDTAEALLKQKLKHADDTPIIVGTETWKSRVIRPAFEKARRK